MKPTRVKDRGKVRVNDRVQVTVTVRVKARSKVRVNNRVKVRVKVRVITP